MLTSQVYRWKNYLKHQNDIQTHTHTLKVVEGDGWPQTELILGELSSTW